MLMFSIGEDWILWSKMNGRKNDFRKKLYDHELQMSSNFFPPPQFIWLSIIWAQIIYAYMAGLMCETHVIGSCDVSKCTLLN
jgi:hypothetical protein